MPNAEIWACPPQVKDLPRDTHIEVTCRSCQRRWSESVQNLIETHRLGVEFVDLLEWKYRCTDETCGGMVRMVFDGEVAAAPAPVRVVTPGRGRVSERTYPMKAVVKPRLYAPPLIPASRRQMTLPLRV